MKMKLLLSFLLVPILSWAQVTPDNQSLIGKLVPGGALPEKITSTRSTVLYSPDFSQKEIGEIHAGLVRTGLDAIAYFETDRVFAGPDVEQAFSIYFTKREISNLVIIEKGGSFKIALMPFKPAQNTIDLSLPSWQMESSTLSELMQLVYSNVLNTYKKQNMLINDVAETDLAVNVIEGRRTEAFASDLKIDRLAVRKFGEEAADARLEAVMKNYPFKYALVDQAQSEADLRKQGYFYVLQFVHTRGYAAKQLLGYEVSPSETALASITFTDGIEKVKTIPANVPVYKFYFRQIEFNNVFLGTKWDADTTWYQALENFISGFRKEMLVN
jgi:hypothetical protein